MNAGHNSQELTTEQRRAIRRSIVEELLEVEGEMQPLRDRKKSIRAKAKGFKFKLSNIDAAIRVATMEDANIFAEEIKELVDIAEDYNVIPETGQDDLFADRRTAEEKAFADGKQAGLDGANPEARPGFDPKAWMEGWHEGQRIRREELQAGMEKINASMDAEQGEPDFPDGE